MRYLSVVFFLLLFTLFIPPCSQAEQYHLEDLVNEVAIYREKMLVNVANPDEIEKGERLLAAGKILLEKDNGDLQLGSLLYEKAVLHGVTPDYSVWKTIAEGATSRREWKRACITWYLTIGGAEEPSQAVYALRHLANALESRSSYGNDWRPAQKYIYEQLMQISPSEETQMRITSLTDELREEQLKKKVLVEDIYEMERGGKPSICLRFNEWFDRDVEDKLAEYIRITPELASEFVIDGRSVCVGGAEFGTPYSVEILKGLPVTKGLTVAENRKLTITTGHRKPDIWFDRNAYVLPKYSATGIALHSINVNNVHFQVYRIHERNLLSDFVRSNFQKKIDKNTVKKIRDRVGTLVWHGKTRIQIDEDQRQVSSLVLPADITGCPGLYVVIAESPEQELENWSDRATQWLVVSDIGLTTYTGGNGMLVSARSLAGAKPLSNISLTLLARNNTALVRQATDERGLVEFSAQLFQDKGGNTPALLIAEDDERGFAFLKLTETPMDLSDRGVGGRLSPGPLDAYVYSERDMYRPGETVNLVSLLRDDNGRLPDSPPMTIKLVAPDGETVLERVVRQDKSGSFITAINLADSARTGNWSADFYLDTEDKPLGHFAFEVKAFLPPRLAVTATSEDILRKDAPAVVQVQADYLYGAPGSELDVDGEMKLVFDPHPFAGNENREKFTGFSFGIDGYKPKLPSFELEPTQTDDSGMAQLICSLPASLLSNQPLKAVVKAEVTDVDGRVVGTRIELGVRQTGKYVGIKEMFSGDAAPDESDAAFQVVVADENGNMLSGANLVYRFVRENVDYQWFRKGDDWGYEKIVTDQELDRGMLLESVGPALISQYVSWGRYRLEILDQEEQLLASRCFKAGDWVEGRSDTPDAVKVVSEKASYLPGEIARIHITAPYAGEGSLVIAGQDVHSIELFSLEGGKTRTFEVPVQKDWDAGAYAVVTVYKPGLSGDVGENGGANRAVGLVWLGVDPEEQTLTIDLQAPEKSLPRQTVHVPVHITGAILGDQVNMTLAAVDEGVLAMSGFTTPDPMKHFFAKQQLGVNIRDFYGRLIKGPDTKPLALRSGAGDMLLRGAAKANVQVVSLFSGVVSVNQEGMADIPLQLPDFNGQLRLMAVAWSKTKTGSAESRMTVADPVVVSPSLPRFLTFEDTGSVQVLLENIDGPEGDYNLQCSAGGALKLVDTKGVALRLDHGSRERVLFRVGAEKVGDGSLHLVLKGPQGYTYQGDFALNVRGKVLPVVTRKFSRLEPGQLHSIDKEQLTGLYPETVRVSVGMSSFPDIDVPGLLGALDRYPYGCLEQLTSRAMPLLYANTLAGRWNYPVDEHLTERISTAIEKILMKQSYDGSFGLWSGNGETEPWLTVYAMDFLSRAEAAGYDVPDSFFNKGVEWLIDMVKSLRQPDSEEFVTVAYAHYVLSRIGKGLPEEARYLFDNYLDKSQSSLATVQLSVALALQGDIKREFKGFEAAFASGLVADDKHCWSYGSRVRDLAAIISISQETGAGDIDPAPFWESLTRELNGKRYLSTQEQAWLIMAALTLEPGDKMKLAVNGKEVETGSYYSVKLQGAEAAGALEIENRGETALWLSTTLQGQPEMIPGPEENGFHDFRRTVFDTNGKLFLAPDGGENTERNIVKQGDQVIVLLEGKVPENAEYRALLVDLIPAGFEISPESLKVDLAAKYSGLPEPSDADYSDALDDRFVAAFKTKDLSEQDNSFDRVFHFAYVLRAVVPGEYTFPPAEVEDMYQPQYRARTEMSRVAIER